MNILKNKITGILIAVLGGSFVIGALANPTKLGIDCYFFTIGLGIFISGWLISIRKVSGVYVYMLTLSIIYIWSLIELWPNISGIAIRIAMPSTIGAYLFFSIYKKLSS